MVGYYFVRPTRRHADKMKFGSFVRAKSTIEIVNNFIPVNGTVIPPQTLLSKKYAIRTSAQRVSRAVEPNRSERNTQRPPPICREVENYLGGVRNHTRQAHCTFRTYFCTYVCTYIIQQYVTASPCDYGTPLARASNPVESLSKAEMLKQAHRILYIRHIGPSGKNLAFERIRHVQREVRN